MQEDFQLHTVHQELSKRANSKCCQVANFQLHTVHQELRGRNKDAKKCEAFNSTRCIRNVEETLNTFTPCQDSFQLHTVHQEQPWLAGIPVLQVTPFNSTRCIRNMSEMLITKKINFVAFQLHTVHQEQCKHNQKLLSLPNAFQLHTVHQEHEASQTSLAGRTGLSTPHGALGTSSQKNSDSGQEISFNSTRCIRNKGLIQRIMQMSILSTPHGALGTFNDKNNNKKRITPFNSTRCIRNLKLPH